MNVFSALADPTRRKILELLAQDGPLPAAEIGAHFQLTPPAISQHLKALREASLVQMDKHAQQRIYRLNPPAVRGLEDWARELTRQWDERFDALDRVLEAEKAKIRLSTSELEEK
jgi:DNA-binding transcriptional ArsR family regulator